MQINMKVYDVYIYVYVCIYIYIYIGAVKGLQGLKRRASANRQQHAFETAELVLNMLGDAEPGTLFFSSLRSLSDAR